MYRTTYVLKDPKAKDPHGGKPTPTDDWPNALSVDLPPADVQGAGCIVIGHVKL